MKSVIGLSHRKYKGLWWLPGSSERKLNGTLSYESGKGSILRLDDVLVEDMEYEYHEVILGDDRGNLITLVGCFRTGYTTHWSKYSNEFRQSTFRVSFFCLGFHFAKKNEIKFKSMTTKLSHLRNWLSITFKFSKREENEKEYILKVKKPPMKEIILKKFRLKIGGYVSYAHNQFDDSFKKHASITIDMTDETPLDKLHSIVYHLKNLLYLATSEEISILSMKGTKTSLEPYKTVEIFSPRILGEKNSTDRFSFIPVPIEYQEISERLEFYLQNWFDLIEKYEPMYELFFGTISERVNPISEFLSLSQALEAYHSRKFDNIIVSNGLFNSLLPHFLEIIEKIPQERQSEFRSKINFMNRKTLRRRTKELFKKHGGIFKIFIENKKGFISKFVDTRNYYTHYDPKAEMPVGIKEIPYLTEKLRFILMVILVYEMGFSQKQIAQIIHRHTRSRIRAIYG